MYDDATIGAAIDAALLDIKANAVSRFTEWRDDPEGFIEKALLFSMWSKQREIARSIKINRRTAVPSCHDVGKDWIAAQIIAWWVACNDPGEAFAVTLAPTAHQVKAILWRELARSHLAGGLPGRLNQTEWWIDPELVAFGRSPRDTDPTAIHGIHQRKVLLVYDEAGGISHALAEGADTLVANEESRVLAIGNPDDPTTWFAEICRPGSGWNVISINAFESPNFTGEPIPDRVRGLLVSKTWVEEKKKSWGVDSPLWKSKVLGEFPEQAEDSLVPISAIKAAHARYEDTPYGTPNELGVDIARMGGDWSVIYRRKGAKADVEHRHNKKNLMELVGAIVRACKKDKPDRIKIDDIGMGGGVTDRLREIQAYDGQDPNEKEAAAALFGVEIVAVNVGDTPATNIADERFRNKRAEINWNMHDLFTDENAVIALGPNDDLDAQAMQIKYKHTSVGEIQIESKADMKKRTRGISPDDWDALCLAFADAETLIGTAMFKGSEELVERPIDIPSHWQRGFCINMDQTMIAIVWGARDPHSDIIRIYDEYKVKRRELAIHKQAIIDRGRWIPGIIDLLGSGRTKAETVKIVDRLSDQLSLFTVELEEDAAFEEMQARISSNRLKVAGHLTKWLTEFQESRREESGDLASASGDYLMRATAMLVCYMQDFETSEAAQAYDDRPGREGSRAGANKTTGY